MQPATAANKQRALEYLSRQEARGGTVLQPAIATAYKYASGDRPLNVVILSDGLTEQQERQTLLQQIQSRPSNTRVFCIGVGNDVNRPLLEQLAEDSGGLSAFLSLQRQLRPAGPRVPAEADAALRDGPGNQDSPGWTSSSWSPPCCRIFTSVRLSKSTAATAAAARRRSSLRGSVKGVEIKQTAQLEFPKTDAANPEINRLWAWHRINSLLKDADRKGDRSGCGSGDGAPG